MSDDEECKKVFPEGSFRVVYRRGHKNLQELLAPSRINDIGQQAEAKKVQQEERCIKCGKYGSNPRGRKRDISLNNCSVLKEGTHFIQLIQLCINDQFRLTCDALLEMYQSTEEAGTRIFTFWEINAISNHSTFITLHS